MRAQTRVSGHFVRIDRRGSDNAASSAPARGSARAASYFGWSNFHAETSYCTIRRSRPGETRFLRHVTGPHQMRASSLCKQQADTSKKRCVGHLARQYRNHPPAPAVSQPRKKPAKQGIRRVAEKIQSCSTQHCDMGCDIAWLRSKISAPCFFASVSGPGLVGRAEIAKASFDSGRYFHNT